MGGPLRAFGERMRSGDESGDDVDVVAGAGVRGETVALRSEADTAVANDTDSAGGRGANGDEDDGDEEEEEDEEDEEDGDDDVDAAWLTALACWTLGRLRVAVAGDTVPLGITVGARWRLASVGRAASVGRSVAIVAQDVT